MEAELNKEFWQCDHPGCGEFIQLATYGEIKQSDLAAMANVIGWMNVVKDGRIVETYCRGCRKAHE